MTTVTFNLPEKRTISWKIEPGRRWYQIGVGVVRDAGVKGRFEARVVITAVKDQLMVSVNEINGSCRDFLNVDWADLLVDSGPVIKALKAENKRLLEKIAQLQIRLARRI